MARDIALYLASVSELGLAAGTNLFWRALEARDPDAAVAVVDAVGDRDDRAGSGPDAAIVEHPQCLVIIRGARASGTEPVAQLAAAIHRALQRIGDDGVELRVAGAYIYLDGTVESPPHNTGDDENGRPRYLVEVALTRMPEVA